MTVFTASNLQKLAAPFTVPGSDYNRNYWGFRSNAWIQPSTTLADQINATPPGGTLLVAPGTYREKIAIRKPITIDFQGAADLRGSTVWCSPLGRTNRFHGTGPYVSDYALPQLFVGSNGVAPILLQSLWPEQVFVDGVPLMQVLPSMTPGPMEFALDSRRRVILGDNPAGHLVEVSERTRWIDVQSDHVTIKNARFMHCASPAQQGALGTSTGCSSFVLDHCELAWAHGSNFGFERMSDAIVDYCRFHHAGDIGVHAGDVLSGCQMLNSLSHDNNTEGYDPLWGAGGFKAAVAPDFLIDWSEFYNNSGPAVWFDEHCSNIVIRNTRIHHNSAGILFEISSDGTNQIYNNAVWENGSIADWKAWNWMSGGGITVSCSGNVDVFNNLSAWNAIGINCGNQSRPMPVGPNQWNNVKNVNIHDNFIFQDNPNSLALSFDTDHNDDSSDPNSLFSPTRNNRGSRNGFWWPSAENGMWRFNWGGSAPNPPKGGFQSSLLAFNAMNKQLSGGNSYYLSAAQKLAICQQFGVPPVPEVR